MGSEFNFHKFKDWKLPKDIFPFPADYNLKD